MDIEKRGSEMEMIVGTNEHRTPIRARSRTKILWLSQHEPESGQWKAMRQKFKRFDLIKDSAPFTDAADIVRRYHEGGYDDLVVVAPDAVLNALVKSGIKPIQAYMTESGAYGLRRFEGSEVKFVPL